MVVKLHDKTSEEVTKDINNITLNNKKGAYGSLS